MTISPTEISVVVQGPVVGKPDDPPRSRLTAACITSIRRYLPGAELILSTWEGADLKAIDCDVLVQSADPGAVSCMHPIQYLFNLNRQIRSTLAGLRKVSRPYAMKIRSDMILEGTGFLDLYSRFTARRADWQVLRERVVASAMVSQNVRRWGLVFAPSDWFHFGRTEDVSRIWDIPEDDGNKVARYFETHPRPAPDKNPLFLCQFIIEQYVWLHCLAKYGPVPCAHLWDNDEENKRLTELTFANNLVLADEGRLGVRFTKYRVPRNFRLIAYTHEEWVELYRRHCDPAYREHWPVRAWAQRTSRSSEVFGRKLWARLRAAASREHEEGKL